MKAILILILLNLTLSFSNAQLLKKLGDKVKQKTDQKVDEKLDKAADAIVNTPENAVNKNDKENSGGDTGDDKKTPTPDEKQDSAINKATVFKTYANYDFVPGDTVLFEDDFTSDQDGEFATHWELEAGQAVVNKIADKSALLITDGGYGWVSPLIKKKSYLNNEWTIEFDTWRKEAAYQVFLFLQNETKNDLGKISINSDGVSIVAMDGDGGSKDFFGSNPAEFGNFYDKWHHVAIAFKNGQLKVYVDQSRVIVVPNAHIAPERVGVGGLGNLNDPIIFTNFRLAAGGKMNMLGKKFTDTKIITHGINFDIDRATIKPESMGTLNMIVKVLIENPDLKFEIGGHTDNTGAAVHNQSLSQKRANAVKTQLITMGVDGTRLTSKGFGDTKPIADNSTNEGKAQNRRVEFVKI